MIWPYSSGTPHPHTLDNLPFVLRLRCITLYTFEASYICGNLKMYDANVDFDVNF